MTINMNFNPMAVGRADGLFKVSSEGYIQGVALDDPALRNELAIGIVAATETLPMFGGVAIAETIAAPASNPLGNSLARATSAAAITGFAVFNQAHNGIITNSNPVPSTLPGMTMPFFRLGSGIRIPVACDEDLAATLAAGASGIGLQVTWDYYGQRLMPYNAATASVNVTSITASYDATSGLWTFAVVAAAPTNVGAVGDAINVSGVSSTGGVAPLSVINTVQIVTSFTNSQNFSFQIADSDKSGADFGAGALAGTIVLLQATGALAVKVLAVEKGNSMIVVNDPVQGLIWNRSGSTALIQL